MSRQSVVYSDGPKRESIYPVLNVETAASCSCSVRLLENCGELSMFGESFEQTEKMNSGLCGEHFTAGEHFVDDESFATKTAATCSRSAKISSWQKMFLLDIPASI